MYHYDKGYSTPAVNGELLPLQLQILRAVLHAAHAKQAHAPMENRSGLDFSSCKVPSVVRALALQLRGRKLNVCLGFRQQVISTQKGEFFLLVKWQDSTFDIYLTDVRQSWRQEGEHRPCNMQAQI